MLYLNVMCEKICRECPWILDSGKSWREYIINNVKDGFTHSVIHRCHMKSGNTYGDTIDDMIMPPTDNLCIGSVKYNNQLQKIK